MVTPSPWASAEATTAGPTKSVPPRTRTLRGIELRNLSGSGLVRPAQEQRGDHAEERQDRDESEGSIERGAERIRRIGPAELGDHRRDLPGRRRLTAVLAQRRVLSLQRAAELGGGELMGGGRCRAEA